jgi:hypothetical protein
MVTAAGSAAQGKRGSRYLKKIDADGVAQRRVSRMDLTDLTAEP